MIAIDTSVWADFFRGLLPQLRDLIVAGQLVHSPVVTGELAMGNLRDRDRTLHFLQQLQPLAQPADQFVLDFVGDHDLFGTGVGWGDAQILCSVMEARSCSLWTLDKRLAAHAERLGCAYLPPG